ncbi:MAG: hypothetical protein HOP16_16605 [Acidobacteria bacterium]|nr:hypothetical protein [Acidobacteriota bacterium]
MSWLRPSVGVVGGMLLSFLLTALAGWMLARPPEMHVFFTACAPVSLRQAVPGHRRIIGVGGLAASVFLGRCGSGEPTMTLTVGRGPSVNETS